MPMINWHIVPTKEEFLTGSPIENDLYFIADTHEIYRGSESYTQSVITYDGELPQNPAVNKLYVHSGDLSCRIYNGTSWGEIIRPVITTINAGTMNPVTSDAVIAYVAQEIAKITGSSGGVVTNITWDDANQILDVFKGETKESITLDGLGVSLQLTSGNLQLLDASGNAIGDPVSLDTDRFITGGEYDPNTKTIVLYFDGKTGDESTDKISIPVGDLVDTYTAGNTSSVNMSVSENQFTATVRISVESGNALELKDDGLFVTVPDVSNKISKVSGATAGNLPVLTADGSLEDSGVAIADVGQPQIFTGNDTPEAAVGSGTARKGDFCIITKTIGSTNKTTATLYLYNGTSWAPADTNYDAANVFLATDIVTTVALPGVELVDGRATLPTAGKSVKEVLEMLLTVSEDPEIVQPSITITCPQAGAHEVGTTITPTYNATLEAGSYEFGPATGVTASAWNVQDSDSHALTTNSGSFDAFQVIDTTNYTITATATYNDGATPLTSDGKDYAEGKIAAGSKSGTTEAITGYRAAFYGTVNDANATIDSALIRALTGKTEKAVAAGDTFEIKIPTGAKMVIVAIPVTATKNTLSSVTDVNGLGVDVLSTFALSQVAVFGAEGYGSINYNVYVAKMAFANDVANTYIAKV